MPTRFGPSPFDHSCGGDLQLVLLTFPVFSVFEEEALQLEQPGGESNGGSRNWFQPACQPNGRVGLEPAFFFFFATGLFPSFFFSSSLFQIGRAHV